MLIEAAIGDAFGCGFEYAPEEFVKEFGNILEYKSHPRHKVKPGSYTDDTQQSLAIAEMMVDDTDWTPDNIAQKFIDVFKRDERKGYSSRLYSILRKSNNGNDLLKNIKADSERSGAAMRAFPLGALKDTDEVIHRAQLQAIVTHNTQLGIAAAIASALTSHYFIWDLGDKRDLGIYLEEDCKEEILWNKDYEGKVGEKGWMSVLAAITAIKNSSSMSELLRKCIAYTGDVDTVATIALGAASFSKKIVQDLPENLFANLENDQFGKDYILALDNKILFKFIQPEKCLY